MIAPAAPLEKAGTILRRVYLQLGSQAPAEYNEAVETLLAAPDADPWWSVWQKTYEHQRKAEDALEEIRDSPTAMGKDIARRYFARREEKGEPNAR